VRSVEIETVQAEEMDARVTQGRVRDPRKLVRLLENKG
jgi:hypothetical protein